QSKAYYASHREEKKASRRKRYEGNRKLAIQQGKAYYEKNTAKMIAAKREWRQTHKAYLAEYFRRRKARKDNATIGDVDEIKGFYEFVYAAESIRCYWCKKLVPKGQRQIDHIHPINKDGAHALLNLCCSC